MTQGRADEQAGRLAGARVLVVEDDPSLSEIVCACLAREGCACTPAFSGTEALLLAGAAGTPVPFDLVVCDLMLPGVPGEQVVGALRERGGVPVIVASAKDAVTDRVALLRLGADDYLVKPFDLDELVARAEVQLRRGEGGTATAGAGELAFGDWRADEDARTFTAAGVPLALTKTEFDIACTLMRRPDKVFTPRELFEAARGEPAETVEDERTVTTHVTNLRAKLRATPTRVEVATVWGIGFKLRLADEAGQ